MKRPVRLTTFAKAPAVKKPDTTTAGDPADGPDDCSRGGGGDSRARGGNLSKRVLRGPLRGERRRNGYVCTTQRYRGRAAAPIPDQRQGLYEDRAARVGAWRRAAGVLPFAPGPPGAPFAIR